MSFFFRRGERCSLQCAQHTRDAQVFNMALNLIQPLIFQYSLMLHTKFSLIS